MDNKEQILIKAFIKASDLKDYQTMLKMNKAKILVDSKINFISKIGYKKSLEIMKIVDYMYWEARELESELLIMQTVNNEHDTNKL